MAESSKRPQGPWQVRTVERPLVGDIIDEQDTHRSAVISGGDGSKPFLSSSVPLRDGAGGRE